MIKRQFIIWSLILLFFNFNAFSENGKSIQWQRIDLETKLRQRISEFLSLIIEENKFFVEVQISASSPNLTLPNFEMPKEDKKKVVQGLKFTDEKNEKSKDNAEYILFDKLGILSPLFESESDVSANDKKMKIKFYQYKEKIERELLTKYDLFGLITNLDITIAFDKSMSSEKIEEIKKLVERVIPKFGEVSPSIEVFQMDFFTPEEIVAEPKEVEDVKPVEKTPVELVKENLPHLTAPVGTIIATILVCLTAFIMLAGYKKHQSALAQVAPVASGAEGGGDEPEAVSMDTGKSNDTVDPNFRPGSPQLIEAISTEKEGIKKLFLYLEKSNDQASNLIKKWINLDSSLSNAALVILSERMSIDELYKVFENLTTEERESWIKVTSSDEITPVLKQQADGFIAQQVMEDIMTVSATEDAELQKLLVELTPTKAAEISRENSDHGAILVNLMSSSFLSQMYLQLNIDEISEISSKGLQMADESIGDKANELKTILKDHVVQKYQNPFSRRVVEVIGDLDPMRQENMLNALVDEGQIFIVRDIVKKVIPVSVIENLSPEILKEVVKAVNKDLRLEYIVSLTDEKKPEFINAVFQEGTKGREVFDFELNKFEEDEVAVARVNKRSEEIKRDFVVEARSIILSNDDIKNQVMEQIDDWLTGLEGGGASSESTQEAA